MSPKAQLEQFAQDVYLVLKNRFFDEIESDDGQVYVSQIQRWSAMFVDELRMAVDAQGNPVNWYWYSQANYTVGSASVGDASTSLPGAVDNLIVGQNRYVQLLQDGTVVSNWAVVSPNQITDQAVRITEDMVARVGNSLIFSREFRDYEDGADITADVTIKLKPLEVNNISLLKTVDPYTLLVLGVAKNASLPDIVQGGLSPSYAQKYVQLYDGALARSRATSRDDQTPREDLSYIRGI